MLSKYIFSNLLVERNILQITKQFQTYLNVDYNNPYDTHQNDTRNGTTGQTSDFGQYFRNDIDLLKCF